MALLGSSLAASTVGACTASGGTLGSNLLTNDGNFGTLSGTPATPSWVGALPAGRTTLKYIDNTIRTSPRAGSPEDGEYTISNSTAYRNDGAWWVFTDHTGSASGAPSGNTRGLMMVINASYAADVFYTQTLTVTPNTNYEYGLWIMNMLRNGGITPNVQIEIDRIANGVTLPTQIVATTGDIPVTNPAIWRAYGALINSGPASQITIRFRNNNPGGGGNDLAIDDLTFTPCTGLSIGSLSGTVYLDANRDNALNLPDSGLGGVTVELLNTNGNAQSSVVTDAAGYYAFYNVPATSYTVRVAPGSAQISPSLVATAPLGAQRNVTLGNGSFVTVQDFGYQQGVDVQAIKTQRLGNTGAFASASLARVPQNQAVQYRLTLKNSGSVAVTAASSLVDTLPSGLTSPRVVGTVSASGGATDCAASFGTGTSSNTLTLSAATLPVGALCRVNVEVIASALGDFTNTATANPPGGVPDYNPANNTDAVSLTVLGKPQVTLAKKVRNLGSPDALITSRPYGTVSAAAPGEVLEYCLDYANAPGTLDAPDFALTDDLPSNVSAMLNGFGVNGSGAGLGIWWMLSGSGAASLLTSAADSDTGELGSRLTLRAGTLASGQSGSVCFRALVK